MIKFDEVISRLEIIECIAVMKHDGCDDSQSYLKYVIAELKGLLNVLEKNL